jgi:hypothetical protein
VETKEAPLVLQEVDHEVTLIEAREIALMIEQDGWEMVM